ncbi:MAG TPA: hypothetical protein VGY98_05210, partial [Verrucomicrobiae bacterium]|nr:hypothetical protein [Verrucomicrobiae bacterium]
GSSRKYAISAKLSRTLPGMAILQLLLKLLVFRPFLGKSFLARLAFEDAAAPPDQGGRDRLNQYPLIRGLNHGSGALLDFEGGAKPTRNDDLTFCSKAYGLDRV